MRVRGTQTENSVRYNIRNTEITSSEIWQGYALYSTVSDVAVSPAVLLFMYIVQILISGCWCNWVSAHATPHTGFCTVLPSFISQCHEARKRPQTFRYLLVSEKFFVYRLK